LTGTGLDGLAQEGLRFQVHAGTAGRPPSVSPETILYPRDPFPPIDFSGVCAVPNRYVRDGVLDSPRYHSVGPLERLAFLELLLNADDWGLVPLHDVFLARKTTAFSGLNPEAIGAKLLQLDAADLIRVYFLDSHRFCYIPRNGFFVRSKKPRYPFPDFEAVENLGRFKELKDLAGKCIASADRCDADSGNRKTVDAYPKMHPTSTSTTTTTLELLPDLVDTAAPSKAGAPPCPVEKIVALWNSIVAAAGGQKALNLSKARREIIVRRWREVGPDSPAEGLSWFEDIFRNRIAASKFCTGRQPGKDGRIYRIGIDVAMRSELQLDQICEGKYA